MRKAQEWYQELRIAQYLGMDPDKLVRKPRWWQNFAAAAMKAEAERDRRQFARMEEQQGRRR